jgi:hypothetical protein
VEQQDYPLFNWQRGDQLYDSLFLGLYHTLRLQGSPYPNRMLTAQR